MTNDDEPGPDRESIPSRLDAFNAFMRRLPEVVYGWSVLTIGVVGAAVYVLAAGQ